MASTTPQKQNQPQRREAGRGIVVGRPFGIPVYISPYWFLIAGVFIVVYARDLSATLHGSTKYVVAAAFVVLLYLSVLVHELSHSLVARGFGLPVRRILLYPLGGLSEIEREPPMPGRAFLVSAAGPAVSLALAAGCYGLSHAIPGADTIIGTLVSLLGWANLVVGGFNLLPGLPLDGGLMLRAAIWKVTGRPGTSTIAAAWAGRVLALALFVLVLAPPVEARIGGDMVTVVWLAVIAAFMWTGASQAIKATRFRERLPALQARRLARKAVSVSADTPLAEAIRRADESQARAVVIVDHDDKPIAILNEGAVMATPPQRRPWIEAGALARTIEPSLVLPADLSGMALLDAIRRAPATEYLLVEPSGQVYGVLAARDVDRAFAGVLPPVPLRLSPMTKARHGPLMAGEPVRLTDPKGRSHLITLRAGASFHTHRGTLSHDDIIGGPDGNVVRSGGGTPYVVFRPLLADFTLAAKRGAAVVYPKDAAQIVAFADVFPGARVLEAGAGSGALSCWLLRAVGEQGTLVSFERRPDFAEIARRNVELFFGGPPPAWQLVVGEFGRPADDHGLAVFDRVILDLLAPWDCLEAAAGVLAAGGVACCYLATTTQLSRTVEALRGHGGFDEPAAWESLVRGWHVEGLAVRPEHRMVGHTGFLVTARRLAPGVIPPARRRRPAKGASEDR